MAVKKKACNEDKFYKRQTTSMIRDEKGHPP